nr:uncharacterized mitochondrial protein AtMg00810-like [Tanacetum cinerariifolium]
MVEKSKLDEDKEGKAIDPSHYRGMIGTLLYLTASRHNLQFAICMCARYQAWHTEKHVHAVKRIFRYLRGTVNRDLWYPKDSSVALTTFADADHAVRKLNTSPYLDVVLKSYGCDSNLRTMALDSTKFQCTAIIKVLLLYAAIMSNTLGLSISTSDTTLSRSRGKTDELQRNRSRLMKGTDLDRGASHRSRSRIGKSNFRLLSDIKSKESTLQLVYDVLRLCPFFKAFLVTSDVPEIYMQEFWATATVHHHAIRFKMYNKKHIVNLKSFRDMLHIFATGAAPPKHKASVRKTRSSSDTTITPPTAAAGPRLTISAKGKQAAKASKAKSLSALFEVAMIEAQQLKLVTKRSLHSTDEEGDDDEGKDGDDDDDNDDHEVERDDEKDDEEEGKKVTMKRKMKMNYTETSILIKEGVYKQF